MKSFVRSRFLILYTYLLGALVVALPFIVPGLDENSQFWHAIYVRYAAVVLYACIITLLFVKYSRYGGSIYTYFSRSVIGYYSSFAAEIILFIEINREPLNDQFIAYTYMVIFTLINFGGFNYLLFVLALSNERGSLNTLWPPVFTYGVFLTYFLVGDPDWTLYTLNEVVGIYEFKTLFHPVFTFFLIFSFVYMAMYSIYIFRRRSTGIKQLDEGRWFRVIIYLGILSLNIGSGIVYAIYGVLESSSLFRYYYSEFFTPAYTVFFSALIYIRFIFSGSIRSVFKIRLDSFYIIGPEGLSYYYLDIDRRSGKKDYQLISGAISAIQNVIAEFGYGNGDIRLIELEERHLLFYKGEHFTYVLVSHEISSSIKKEFEILGTGLDDIVKDKNKDELRTSEEIPLAIRTIFG